MDRVETDSCYGPEQVIGVEKPGLKPEEWGGGCLENWVEPGSGGGACL